MMAGIACYVAITIMPAGSIVTGAAVERPRMVEADQYVHQLHRLRRKMGSGCARSVATPTSQAGWFAICAAAEQPGTTAWLGQEATAWLGQEAKVALARWAKQVERAERRARLGCATTVEIRTSLGESIAICASVGTQGLGSVQLAATRTLPADGSATRRSATSPFHRRLLERGR